MRKFKGKKRADLRPSFYDSLKYIKESKNYIYFIISVFALSALTGFFFASELRFLDDILKEIVDKTSGLNTGELILFIFSNNVESALFGMLLGAFLGIFSIGNALINGTVIGYVFARVYSVSKFSDFWRILPHGIFELPAIFISLGLGTRLGMSFFSGNIWLTLRKRLWSSAVAFILIVVPLLVVAAIIEGLLISLFS